MNEGEQSLVNVSLFLWKGKYIVISTVIVFVGLALITSLLMAPVYRAEGSYEYVAELDNRGLSGLGGGGALGNLAAGLGGNLFSSGSSVHSALETLGSRAFLIEFAEENDLAPKLFPEMWDQRKHAWAPSNDVPSKWEISERLESRISSSLIGKTGLISISVTWDDPVVATKILSDFVNKANSDLREKARDRTSARLDYLTAALDDSRIMEVKASIGDLIKNEVERKMMISIEEEFAFRTLSPPIPADHDAFVRPNRSLMVVSAVVFGFFLGLMISYARELFQEHRESGPHSAV